MRWRTNAMFAEAPIWGGIKEMSAIDDTLPPGVIPPYVPQPPAATPWYKNKKILIGLAVVAGFLIFIYTHGSGGGQAPAQIAKTIASDVIGGTADDGTTVTSAVCNPASVVTLPDNSGTRATCELSFSDYSSETAQVSDDGTNVSWVPVP